MLIFLHGTVIMHKNGLGKTREERVEQVLNNEESVLDFISYVPVENSVNKLNCWAKQGAEILYLSSHENSDDVKKDKYVLIKYGFPSGEILFRKDGKSYKDLAERVMPDIFIEDDCESIGGESEMVYPNLSDEGKARIKSIIVKEFNGIDDLNDNIDKLKYSR